MLDLQPPQRLFQRRGDGCWRSVDATLPVLATQHAFARQRKGIAPVHQRAAQQFLIRAKAIERGGIEEIDPDIERMAQQPLGLLRVGARQIGVAQIHAAKADGLDRKGADGAGRGQ